MHRRSTKSAWGVFARSVVALLEGSMVVTPDHVRAVFSYCLNHRIDVEEKDGKTADDGAFLFFHA